MAVAKVVEGQRNFSGGEADASIKRSDEIPLLKAAGRQMRNWRILNSGSMTNRPGRTILGLEGPRVEEVFMTPTQKFYLVFGNTYLRVYNAAFTKVFDSGNSMPWTTTTAQNVVWAADSIQYQIFICFAGSQPQVLSWDGVSQSSTWTLVNYAEQVNLSGQKRTIFYRLSPLGVTLQPSGTTGTVTLTFSAGMNLVSGHVGTRIRHVNRQILITAVGSSTSATGLIEERLYNGAIIVCLSDPAVQFSIGDEVIGKTSGAKGLVVGFAGDGIHVNVQHLDNTAYGTETLVGPNGSLSINGTTHGQFDNWPPYAITVWDDEVMNSFRGWPAACAFDQSRLIFNNFPPLPQLIAWSAIGNSYDLYTDANNVAATNAIQELAPQKSQVLYVIPGMEGSEFVFTDRAVYYIPINQTTPLQPGSVAFNTIATDGAASVKPRNVQESIVYVGFGGTQVKVIQSVGAYNRPYIIDDISLLHSHLLNSPIAIAAPAPSAQFEERYFYILNSDGSILVAKYAVKQGLIDTQNIGLLPWSGSGTATWIAGAPGQSDFLISGTYAPNGIAAVNITELMDKTQFLDAGMLYNSAPASLTPPGGKGPLWFLANGTVDLMDGSRMMGTYNVDANGFLIPQNNAGEDFTSVTLTAGQAWTATFEPFVPAVQPGQDVGQRLRRRRIARWTIYVTSSTGFVYQRIFGGPITPTSPAIGTVMQQRRVDTWNQDDDPTKAPPQREQTYLWRPVGRNHDPRVAIVKDTPGPLTIMESSLEVTV